MKHKHHITGIILAGGKSSRMGTDKGFISFKNQPFTQHILNAINPLTAQNMIISNTKRYEQFGVPVYEDLIKEAGPLAGLYTGLYYTSTELNLVVSCDTPLITTELLTLLVDAYEPSYEAIVFKDQKGLMPLLALYHKQSLDPIKLTLDQGQRRLKDGLAKLKSKTLHLAPKWEQAVSNINTKDDLNSINHATSD